MEVHPIGRVARVGPDGRSEIEVRAEYADGLLGIGVLALNLFVFNMFVPLLVEFSAWGVGGLSYVDLFVRTAIDVAAVVVGVLVFERLSSMRISREVSERTPADG